MSMEFVCFHKIFILVPSFPVKIIIQAENIFFNLKNYVLRISCEGLLTVNNGVNVYIGRLIKKLWRLSNTRNYYIIPRR